MPFSKKTMKGGWNAFLRKVRMSLALAKASIQLKNENTWLGITWYLVNPILTFASLWFIFADLLSNNISDYGLYLFIGIIHYNLFQQATSRATNILRTHSRTMKSLNFPREILPASVVLSSMFSHIFQLILLTAYLLLTNKPMIGLLFYPIIILPFAAFLYGSCLLLSSIYIFIADIEYIWPFISRILFFVTPVMYATSSDHLLTTINLFNPLYYFITLARHLIIDRSLPASSIMIGTLATSFLFLIAGSLIFNYLKPRFTDVM